MDISSREMLALSTRLKEERDRLTTILHSVGDGLCALDPDGRVLFTNPEAERLLGWRQVELVGRDLLATIVGANGTHESSSENDPISLQLLVGAGETYRNEDGLFVRKDGTLLPRPWCDQDDPLVGDGDGLTC